MAHLYFQSHLPSSCLVIIIRDDTLWAQTTPTAAWDFTSNLTAEKSLQMVNAKATPFVSYFFITPSGRCRWDITSSMKILGAFVIPQQTPLQSTTHTPQCFLSVPCRPSAHWGPRSALQSQDFQRRLTYICEKIGYTQFSNIIMLLLWHSLSF